MVYNHKVTSFAEVRVFLDVPYVSYIRTLEYAQSADSHHPRILLRKPWIRALRETAETAGSRWPQAGLRPGSANPGIAWIILRKPCATITLGAHARESLYICTCLVCISAALICNWRVKLGIVTT